MPPHHSTNSFSLNNGPLPPPPLKNQHKNQQNVRICTKIMKKHTQWGRARNARTFWSCFCHDFWYKFLAFLLIFGLTFEGDGGGTIIKGKRVTEKNTTYLEKYPPAVAAKNSSIRCSFGLGNTKFRERPFFKDHRKA